MDSRIMPAGTFCCWHPFRVELGGGSTIGGNPGGKQLINKRQHLSVTCVASGFLRDAAALKDSLTARTANRPTSVEGHTESPHYFPDSLVMPAGASCRRYASGVERGGDTL